MEDLKFKNLETDVLVIGAGGGGLARGHRGPQPECEGPGRIQGILPVLYVSPLRQWGHAGPV